MAETNAGSERNGSEPHFDSSDSVIVEVGGVEDTTVRPRPPNVPRGYQRPSPPQAPPASPPPVPEKP